MNERTFIRVARCLALAKIHGVRPEEIAPEVYADDAHRIVGVLKAAIDPATTAGALHQPDRASAAFVESIRPRTILGRLSYLSVPFMRNLPFLTVGTSADFYGEAQPIAVNAGTLSPLYLPHSRISGLVVISNELLESSEGEEALSRDLQNAVIEAQDRRLLDPTSDDGSGIRPASVTNTATPIDAGGVSTAAHVDAVVAALIAEVSDAGSTLENAAFITTPDVALGIASLRDTGGGRAFPGVGVRGGELGGLPLLTSAAAPADALILLDGSEVVVADDSEAQIATSQNATIDMSDGPSGANLVGMFQAEASALRVSRWVHWTLRRPYVSIATGLDLTLPEVPSS